MAAKKKPSRFTKALRAGLKRHLAKPRTEEQKALDAYRHRLGKQELGQRMLQGLPSLIGSTPLVAMLAPTKNKKI
jgi:hypothetical protein